MMTTNPATQEYSCFRKALAPAWISFMRSTMRLLPGGAAFTTR